MSSRTFVVGVGMTKFEKIGSRDWEYPAMVAEAVGAALADAGIRYDAVQRAAVGYVFQPSAAGQRVPGSECANARRVCPSATPGRMR